MNRPELVRRIYAELRSSAEPGEPAAELLRAASAIAEAYYGEIEEKTDGATFYTGGVPFEAWCVDRAIADGGWRLLCTDGNLVAALFNDSCTADSFALNPWLEAHHA